jgi:hypothetical protein
MTRFYVKGCQNITFSEYDTCFQSIGKIEARVFVTFDV